MAGDAVIGALRVVLGADTAAFEDGLKKATSSANSFAAGVTKIAAGIGLEHAIEKVVEGIVEAFKRAIEAADQMGKTAQKVGVPVEELSKLRVAAELSDVSMESLSTGLGKLSKAMLEAAQNSASAEAPFKRLGIEVTTTDGKMRSVTDVLADVADKFEHTNDGAVKTATAMQLFGKSGKDLIPLLNDGKHGLEEMAKAAENMGLVISKDTAAQSQKLMDNIKLLDLAKQGLINTIMVGLLPALVRVSDQMVENVKSGDAMKVMADSVVDSVKNVSVWFAAQAAGAKETASAIGELWGAMKALPSGDFEKARQHLMEMNKINAATPAVMEAAGKAIKDLFLQITVAPKVLGDMQFDEKLGKAIEDLVFKTRILRHEFDTLSVGLPEALKAAGVPIEQIGTSVDSLKGKAIELNARLAEFQAAKFNEDALTSWQVYENQINRINQAWATGNMSVEAYQMATQKAAVAVATTWGTTAQAIVSPMATAFKTLSEMNKSYAGIAKAAAIGEALVNTYLAATKALASVPPPFNFAAAAAVTAAGLVQVAKISATQFAQGGSFKVGGVGGRDSKLIQMMLTPGEMVNVKKPGDTADDGGRGSQVNVTIHGESISRDQVRELFDTINAGMRDGYRLNLAA